MVNFVGKGRGRGPDPLYPWFPEWMRWSCGLYSRGGLRTVERGSPTPTIPKGEGGLLHLDRGFGPQKQTFLYSSYSNFRMCSTWLSGQQADCEVSRRVWSTLNTCVIVIWASEMVRISLVCRGLQRSSPDIDHRTCMCRGCKVLPLFVVVCCTDSMYDMRQLV